MESVTYLKNIKIAPKKLRLMIPQIKRLRPVQALSILLYTPKKPAKILYKAVHSALSNAKQTLKVSEDLLQFKVLSIDEGQKLKRFNPGSRGTAKPYTKKFSHIKIVLWLSQEEKKQPVSQKPQKGHSEKQVTTAALEQKTPEQNKKLVKVRKSRSKVTINSKKK